MTGAHARLTFSAACLMASAGTLWMPERLPAQQLVCSGGRCIQASQSPYGAAEQGEARKDIFYAPLAAAPQGTSGASLTLFTNYFVRGDYAVAGVGLRGSGSGTIVMSGVPAGAEVVAAYLYWETLGNGQLGSFRGVPIAGNPLGTTPSPCWSQATITVYRADVRSLLPTDAAGRRIANGNHVVTFPDSGNFSVAPSTEGASLVVVYKAAGLPYKAVVLYDGAFTMPGSDIRFDLTIRGFSQAAFSGVQARITHIVGDGQEFLDQLQFNGIPIGNGLNAFAGAQGPLWDNLTADVSSLVPPGATSVTTSAVWPNLPVSLDCLTWGAVVFSTNIQDSDGDGLPDVWEISGIDSDNDGVIDLVLPGANPLHKDIFVEADYMQAGNHSHNPDPNAVNDVVRAFASAPVGNPDGVNGISLHIETDESVAEQTPLAVWSGFDSLKASRFGTAAQRSGPNGAAVLAAKRLAYHYALFIHQMSGTTSSGRAELPGNDFIVSLGAFTNQTGTRRQQAGTIMHELGHNLNLRHGGGDDLNYKPNYLSIMNYSFQMEGITNLLTGTRLDYSRQVLGDLTETTLSELSGIGDGADVTRYFCPGSSGPSGIALGFLPIDWNCNGLIALFSSVAANVNGDSLPLGSLSGFNDWANLKLAFQDSPDFADGVHETAAPNAEVTQELDLETSTKIPPIETIRISIKPGDSTNPINLKSRGVTPVAILSTPTFDATLVDPRSVRFAGSASLRNYSFEDVDFDGRRDLVLQFETASLQLTTASTTATLTGMTSSGIAVIGMDSVRVF